jgi:hypothetical protein
MADIPPDGDRRAPGRDRRSSHTYIDADGTLVFGDGYGETWRVYDRRSGERRAGLGRGDSGYYRAFVNSAGEEWRCLLSENEIIDETTFALEGQLARAVRHLAASEN